MDLSKAKKLFARPKDDPAFLTKQVKIRQVLLKNLARVVKETQLLFARTEGEIIKDCRPVQRLCARFEDILRHGLKAGWFSAGKDPTFWPIVLKISRKQAIEYINRLQYAQTDSGKCRAWIRLAVNECSLESYINVLTHDYQMLSYYYESHAFLRDEEVVSPFRQLLTGLSQIGFDIPVDTASLEFAPAPEVLEPVLRLRAPQPVQGKKSELVHSSTSSPQVSTSSDSSWGSSSADSSSLSTGIPEATPTTELHVHNSNIKPDVQSLQMIKDEVSGLEASYHIEDTVLVIDSVSERGGAAYTDLSRFNQALEDSEEEEEEVIKEESKEREGGAIKYIPAKDDDDDDGDIMMFDDKLPHGNVDANATPPVEPVLCPISDEIQSIPEGTGTSIEPQDEVDVSLASQEGVLDKPDVDLSLDEEMKMEVAEAQENDTQDDNDEQTVEKVEQVEEVEYSYGDILLMAKGLSPSKDNEMSAREREDTLKEETGDMVSYSQEGPTTTDDNDVIKTTDEAMSSNVSVKVDLPTSVDYNSTNPFLTDFTDQPTQQFVQPATLSPNPFFDEEEESQPNTHPVIPSDKPTNNPFDIHSSPNVTPLSRSPAHFSPSPLLPDSVPAPDNTGTSVGTDNTKLLNVKNNETEGFKEKEEQVQEELVEDIGEGYNRERSVHEDEREVSFLTSEGIEKMSLNEEYFEEELTIELVEYQIAQLKNHLRRHSNDINSQKKLLKLQLLKQEMKELSEIDSSDVKVCGHQLTLLPKRLKARKCDTCNKPTVNPLQVVMSCSLCGYFTHAKCLSQINQKCIFLAMKEQSGYTMNICPEKGLTPQHFRCACCNQALNNSTEVRLCDYTGQYYCPDCHHNETAVIPARVLHNWDFTSRKVLRKDIILMKEYLVKCERARTEKLIQELNSWPHFKDSSILFSLSDLMNVQEGNLLSQLEVVHQMFLSHITNECEKCSANGTACAVCHSRDLLFRFSKDVVICPNCSSHFHRDCYVSLKNVCAVCSPPAGKKKTRFSRKKN
ncbi:PREDICTED: uncharacterized protein LOC105313847 isoform X2 [Amphimedon queenslandica]|uniref:RUN domain-containing protein n=1 Tax=Amphimedon queenslandica TaxID=400682 RepID=A0A1X7U6M6_AMPQE|nr:PREDICTED: uncharacterized protein LOC105313847 isoform X2 [Amphimedon queenslandica]|eukprot:XP_019855820.1 PREDICTED: uncharacterized protein LOC105313847 isoform X2 [Amphimedon queenslandica]